MTSSNCNMVDENFIHINKLLNAERNAIIIPQVEKEMHLPKWRER